MKRLSTTSAFIAACIALATTASAQPEIAPAPAPVAASQDIWNDKSASSLGLGLGNSVAGTSGLVVHKFFNPTWGFQGVLGVSLLSATITDMAGNETKRGANTITLGAYAVQQILTWNRATVSGVYGAEFSSVGVSSEVGGMDSSNRSSDIALAGGAQIDFFVLPGLSVWAQSGLRLVFLGENSTGGGGFADESSGYILKLGPNSVAGMFGMTWWM